MFSIALVSFAAIAGVKVLSDESGFNTPVLSSKSTLNFHEVPSSLALGWFAY